VKEVLVRNADYASVLADARDFAAPGLERVHAIMESVADGAPGNLAGHLQQLLNRRGKRVVTGDIELGAELIIERRNALQMGFNDVDRRDGALADL
jgi:hypothetical protein